MGPTMKDLGIDQLPPDQRVALAKEIWDSLGEATPGGHLSDAQKAELDRRDAEMDADPSIAVTWEDIRSRLGKRR